MSYLPILSHLFYFNMRNKEWNRIRKITLNLKYEIQHIFQGAALNPDPIQDLNHKHFFTQVK